MRIAPSGQLVLLLKETVPDSNGQWLHPVDDRLSVWSSHAGLRAFVLCVCACMFACMCVCVSACLHVSMSRVALSSWFGERDEEWSRRSIATSWTGEDVSDACGGKFGPREKHERSGRSMWPRTV